MSAATWATGYYLSCKVQLFNATSRSYLRCLLIKMAYSKKNACSTTVLKTEDNIFASSRHFLSLQVHNCLLIWSPYAVKCMFVCALCKNTFFFLVFLKLFCGVWLLCAAPPQLCAQPPVHSGLGGDRVSAFCRPSVHWVQFFFTMHSFSASSYMCQSIPTKHVFPLVLRLWLFCPPFPFFYLPLMSV